MLDRNRWCDVGRRHRATERKKQVPRPARRGGFARDDSNKRDNSNREITPSKRNIFVRDLRAGWRLRMFRLGGALVHAAGLALASAAFATGIASSEQHQIVDDDLGLVFLLASLLVIPGIAMQTAFDVNLATLLQVLGGDFGGTLEGHQVVPLGAILPVPVFVFDAIRGRH